MTNSAPPLEGITVLDFSHALAGPYCTMLMAAHGASVIKIESPEQGDIGRTWGPPFQGSDTAPSVMASAVNRLTSEARCSRRPSRTLSPDMWWEYDFPC